MSLRVFITGANRGLGLEFVQQYVRDGARVFAAARAPHSQALRELAASHGQQLTLVPLDVRDDSELKRAAEAVRTDTGALDLLINNAGVTSRGLALGSFTSGPMLDVLHVNAVAPVLVGQALLDLLLQGTRPRIVNVSSQIGSFGWNTSGMSPLYAASKAALNMYTRSFANAAKGVTTIVVHPGWVQTDMGGSGAPLTPAQAVASLRQVIDRLTPADNGKFLNYDGAPHPW